MLAVNFDELAADRPHRLHAHRLIVDEGAGPAVGHLHAPQDEVAGRLDVVAAGGFAGRVIVRQVEDGDDLALHLAFAHQRTVAARPERQRESIEQNGLAGAGFAGQHGQPGPELQIEPIDQNDVTDRELCEHRAMPGGSAESHFLEYLGNPGALVLVRLQAPALQQIIGVVIPVAVREIVSEHGGGRLRLVGDPEPEIGLGQPIESLFGVACRLVFRQHVVEPVDRRRIIVACQIIAPDRHFLAGELIANHLNLVFGIIDIFRLGEFLRRAA